MTSEPRAAISENLVIRQGFVNSINLIIESSANRTRFGQRAQCVVIFIYKLVAKRAQIKGNDNGNGGGAGPSAHFAFFEPSSLAFHVNYDMCGDRDFAFEVDGPRFEPTTLTHSRLRHRL